MLIESLLSAPLSSSISDRHWPSAAADEPTSECSRTSPLQPSPRCCAPEQGGFALHVPELRTASEFDLQINVAAVAVAACK